MADKRITDLPLILSGDITSNDVLPIVNIDLDITNKIEVDQLKSYILNGVNDYYVTGGTYSGGTLVLDRQDGSVTITGFTTGSTQLYETGSGYHSTQRVGVNSDASGIYSLVSGGFSNTASGYFSVVSGGFSNTASCDRSTIVGGSLNTTSGLYSSIGGGFRNEVLGYSSTISGGYCNTTSLVNLSTISGGYCNTINNSYSFIGGGFRNKALGYSSTIVGGYCNTTDGDSSMILGGCSNTTIGVRSAVVGGQNIVSTENDMVYMPSANIQSIGYLYFGDVNTDGSWRMSISGATFIIEKRVGGSWVTSGTFV
jgi:hypothetical protein